jgi:hypothetical protein
MAPKRAAREAFSQFFENPSRNGLRTYLGDHLGESTFVDFKQEWIAAPDLARIVLGFANKDDACIIVGVKEEDDKSLTATGILNKGDIKTVTDGLRKYLPQPLIDDQIEVVEFSFWSADYANLQGKQFQVMFITHDPARIPYLAMRDGAGIKRTAIYIRRHASVEEATYAEIQDVLNRRIATRQTTPSDDIRKDIDQFKILYQALPRAAFENTFGFLGGAFALGHRLDEFHEFLHQAVQAKQFLILTKSASRQTL